MRNYLSFGGGVNSVALYLLMRDLKVDFEAVFVDHGGDWPETYEYVDYFISTGRPVTVLKPSIRTVEGEVFDNLYDYCEYRKVTPSEIKRWCTDRAKIVVLEKYQQKPCWVFIGFASDEAHRAKITSKKGFEYRWPLIEHGIDRAGCIQLIQRHGLRVPRKSGCYFCPFQGRREFDELRRKHPDLFCKARRLEDTQNERVTKDGRPWKPYYLSGGKPLSQIINEKQLSLPTIEDEVNYPPCECGL